MKPVVAAFVMSLLLAEAALSQTSLEASGVPTDSPEAAAPAEVAPGGGSGGGIIGLAGATPQTILATAEDGAGGVVLLALRAGSEVDAALITFVTADGEAIKSLLVSPSDAGGGDAGSVTKRARSPEDARCGHAPRWESRPIDRLRDAWDGGPDPSGVLEGFVSREKGQ
jgi:hypothetical protein